MNQAEGQVQPLDASGFRDMVRAATKQVAFLALTSRMMGLPDGSSQEAWDDLITVRETLDAAVAEMNRATDQANALTNGLQTDAMRAAGMRI